MGELRRLCYQYRETHYQSFKRYMFRWDGIVSGSVFQLARLMIDDVDLPYTYVNWGASGGNTISTQPATAMIASTSSYDNPNLKWCRTSVNSSSYGWLIFDLPDTHEIHSYRVLSGEDTALDTGRNPLRIRLYGTTSEATTDSDASWVLLSDVSNNGNSNIPTSNRTWSKYFKIDPIEDSLSFKTFKWVLKGRWNQGTGNSGNTRTYQQWDELGISYVGSDGVKYGPSYWTVDSFSSSGTPWADMRGPADLFDGEWGSETSKCDYYNINDTDGYVEIIIHTTSREAIIPNGVGLISANLQANYASSTPGHFILYGLDESTNEYVQLIDVGAASVNKGNTQTTTVSFDPAPIIKTKYLIAPSDISRGSGLRWEMPPMEVWVNDSTEYVAQGGSTRQRNVSFASSIPSTSDMNYITWILDCYLTGGSGGAARINYWTNGGSGADGAYWVMYAHFNRSLPSIISIGSASSNWHTDHDATSYIQIVDNVYVNTTLWPKATYKTFKYVFDRTNHRTYFYCEGIYLGYTDILTQDPIKINAMTLYSDQNRSYEIAKIKNVKVAAFSTLSDARAWNGTI